MYRLLVVEDNTNHLQNIVNIILSNIPAIKLYGIAYTGEEALKIIDKQVVDIILLDLRLPGISGIDILKYINKKICIIIINL